MPTTRSSARSRPTSRPRSRRAAPGTSSARSRSPWTRCASRRPTPTSPPSPVASAAASRCAGCCSAAPTCCCSTSRPTTSTPSRWRGSSASCSDYAGTVVAITHDRYFLDNVARWILELDHGKGIPFEGNYSSWLEQKQERLRMEEKQESARARTLAHELEWVRMAPKARQAKGKARLSAYEQLLAESQAAQGGGDKLEIFIPRGERLGDVVIEAEDIDQGVRRPAADRGPHVLAPPRRHRRRHRSERCGQDHAVPHDHRRGAGRRRRAARRAHRRPRLRRPEPRRPRRRPDRLRGDHRRSARS